MPSPIELNTTRLRLRQWQASDRTPFATLNADPVVMEHFPAPLTAEQSNALMERITANIAERGWGFWAVEHDQTKQFIGFVGLEISPAALPCSPGVEIGWRLSRTAWGQGYATEAARGALKLGFDTLHLNEIVSFTSLTNERSQRVMERLTMTRDKSTFEHPNVPEGSHLREHCLFRLAHATWQAQIGDH